MLRDALTHTADSFYCGYYTWMMGNTIQSAANKHNVNGNKSEKFQGSWIGMVNYELLIKIQLIVKLKFVTMLEFLNRCHFPTHLSFLRTLSVDIFKFLMQF